MGTSRWRWLDDSEWDALAGASPAATFFHRRAWSAAVCAHDRRFEPRALGLLAARGDWALVPLALRRGVLRRGLAGRAASTQPGTYGGPLLAARALGADDWSELQRSLDAAPIGRIDCFDNVLDPAPANAAAVVEERETHVLVLADLPEDPRSSYRKGCKHSLTKAKRAGLVCERATDAAAIAAYFEIYADSLRRWDKDEGQAYPRALFEALVALPGAELWTVRTPEGRLAAGGLFLFTARHCVWWHGAMLAELADLGGSNLLIHELVQRARARGCELFDFNPSGGHAGVASFKRSFGAEPRPLRVWRHYHPLLARFRGARRAAQASEAG